MKYNHKGGALIPAILHFFIRNTKHPFPRRVYRKYPQSISENVKSLKELTEFARFKKDIYVSLFSDDEIKSSVYDVIFLDIDRDEMIDAFHDMKKVITILMQKNIFNFEIIMSGKKGFHVYVGFKPTLIQNYRDTVIKWLENNGILQYVDIVAIGTERLVRMPYTFNGDSLCAPITGFLGNELTEIMDQIKDTQSRLINFQNDISDELRLLDSNMYRNNRENNAAIPDDYALYPPCMQRLISMAGKGVDLGHLERWQMGVMLLITKKWDVDAAAKYFEKMTDYNEHYTKYQLRRFADKKYNMMRCTNLRMNGLCVFKTENECKKECPYYPSINKVKVI